MLLYNEHIQTWSDSERNEQRHCTPLDPSLLGAFLRIFADVACCCSLLPLEMPITSTLRRDESTCMCVSFLWYHFECRS